MSEKNYQTPLPWYYQSGGIYAVKPRESRFKDVEITQEVRVILADREEPGTYGAERDDNLKFVVEAVNAHDDLVARVAALRAALVEMASIPFSNYIHAVELDEISDQAGWTKRGTFFESDVEMTREALADGGFEPDQIDAIYNEIRIRIAQQLMDEMENGNEDG